MCFEEIADWSHFCIAQCITETGFCPSHSVQIHSGNLNLDSCPGNIVRSKFTYVNEAWNKGVGCGFKIVHLGVYRSLVRAALSSEGFGLTVMAHEGEKVALRKTPNQCIDSVKQRNGLLSFRSRKIVNGLLKKSGVNEVGRSSALPAVDASHVEQSDFNQAKPSGQEQERNKVCGELWNPMKVESDSARARTQARNRKMSKQLATNEKNGKEGQLPNGGGNSTKQLPPKLKLLETFYEGLEAATSLLRIRHQMCTFTSVRKIVESMSRRRFLPKHLAQIKHIFSEELHLEYVRCQDPDTWGEKWDLRITLLPLSAHCTVSDSPLKGSAGQTAQAVRRRKEFRARLLKFASSLSEEGDIPQGPLPQRPLGGKLPPSSQGGLAQVISSRRQTCDSSVEGAGNVKFAVGATPRAKSKADDEDSFTFSIVKPSREECSVHLEGTPHFSSSFNPFFSVQHEAVDGTPHFPASFKPFFSVKRTSSYSTDVLPVPDVSEFCTSGHRNGTQFSENHRAVETVHQAPCNGANESTAECAVPHGTSSEASVDELPDDTTHLGVNDHFSPSFRPAFSSSLTDQSLPCTSGTLSSPSLRHSDFLLSPAPVHTPSFLSPMNPFRVQSELHCKTPSTISSRYSSESKSQGIMRSLKFGSPVRSSSAQLIDSDSTLQTPSSVAQTNSSQVEKSETKQPSLTPPFSPPSTPSVSLKNVHPNTSQSTVFTPPPTPANTSQDKSSLLSPVKSSIPRSLQFSTPVKVSSKSDVISAEVSGVDNSEHVLFSTSNNTPGKAPRSVSPTKSLPSTSPSTPALRTPVRAPRSLETLYSPPKRTKLNRVSLFTKEIDEKDDEIENTSEARIISETMTNSEAVGKGDTVNVVRLDTFIDVRKSTAALKVINYSTADDIQGISAYDLDIIESLPLDLVQSVREKEMKIKDETSRELAKEKRRQQMIGGLSKLVNHLRLIFQSLNRSVMPRSELVKNILRSHPDISDQGEIEERLQLLTELAPDWMSAKPSQKGELLYRIDKRADVVKIQRRLSATSNAVC